MRTLIDLPQEQLDALTRLGEKRGSSVSTLVREAVSEYLVKRQAGDLAESFGLWPIGEREKEQEDGVAYQRRSRAEWE